MQVLVNAEVINKCSSTEPDISLDNLKILFLTRALIRERGRIVYLMNSNQICVICAPALPVIPCRLLPVLTSEWRWGSRGAVFKSPASATCWGDAINWSPVAQMASAGGSQRVGFAACTCTSCLWLWVPLCLLCDCRLGKAQ